MNDLFWEASEEERELGYCKKKEVYHCLLCDFTTEQGYVYPDGQRFVDARKQMALHIEGDHGGVFNYLTTMDKKENGLSQHQSRILRLFYEGLTDYDIQQQLTIGSLSTIRNHRFALKEKEKQAKTFVTLMSLFNKGQDPKQEKVKPHETATMVDSRYDVTLEESMTVIDKYFPQGTDGPITTFYVKEKHKLILLREIVKKFEMKKRYTEKEVDVILKHIYPDDHALIRRYLIQYGFMAREKDGSAYWVKDINESSQAKGDKKKVDLRKKELMQAYKVKVASEEIEDGIYQIKNRNNNKVFIGSARDINKLNGLTFQLNMGSFTNRSLQKEWTDLGEDQFEITVLDRFKRDKNKGVNSKKLRALEVQWKEKLQPYGDKGYHRG